jgi:predicted DNA-binding protein YlxM (UPF0122 family)
MSNIKDLLLNRLLNEWLSEWKEKAPDRFVDKWGDGVPEYWCNGLDEKVSDDWLNQLLDTRSAIQKLSGEKYQKLAHELKNKYSWVGSMNAGKIWNVHSDAGNEPQITRAWKDFLTQAIEILLAKTHCQWDDSDIELLYLPVKLKIEALADSLIPNVYKAELHGRTQPQSWEDFFCQAVELLLAGKREWNQEEYPEISEQIKAIVDSLVSAVYEQHKIVKALYSDWAHKWRFISSQREEDDEDDEWKVQYTRSELEDIAKKVECEQVEIPVSEKPNLDYISELNLGDDEELRWFVNRLPVFIDVKNPYKHRISVILKPNKEIAEELGLSTKRVRELKRKLHDKLQPYQDKLN